MAEDNQKDAIDIPPYLPWPTFIAFVEKLNKTAVPNRIDPTLIKNLSGTAQSQLLSALKYLGLTNGNGAVTDKLKTLVKAYGTPNWAEALSEHFMDSYSELIGTLDLDTATPGELKERFREYGGIEGDTVEKAMRFYLNALKDAGVSYSPHLKIRQRAARGTGQRRRKAVTGGGAVNEAFGDNGDYGDPPIPEGTIKLPFPLPNKPLTTLILAEGISEAEWSMIDGYVRNYIKLSTEKE
jgi:Family of unknown function (DUF5343)